MENKGISKLDLKRRNRKQILLAIRQAGMLARVDIASKLSLTRAAVTIITNQMISQLILEDLSSPVMEGDEPKKKGRKKTMIRINPKYRFVLGAMVGEDRISVGLTNLYNETLDKASMEISDGTDAQEIIQFVVNACKELMKKSSLSSKHILGLGVGVVPDRWAQVRGDLKPDGSVDFKKLTYMLEIELSVPVCVESAIGLYALANIDYQNTKHHNEVLIYAGSTYQLARISDHWVLPASAQDSQKIDRFVLDPQGTECMGYPRGSVHAEIGTEAIIAKVKAACGKELKLSQIFAAYEKGDAAIVERVNGVLDQVALLVFDLAMVHSATRVVLQQFALGKKAEAYLRGKLSALSGKTEEIELVVSKIEGEHSFQAGCALSIERHFYEQGGMPIGE
ncbi:MAG: ROK family protein [Oscillospiraceae bacterium]|nr:ROK family protein [Oscillospiraceae bacterium]